eukprot:4691537-Pleurochrysis_carterae.AAC.7
MVNLVAALLLLFAPRRIRPSTGETVAYDPARRHRSATRRVWPPSCTTGEWCSQDQSAPAPRPHSAAAKTARHDAMPRRE